MTQPSDQTVGVGGTASLSVVAEGAGTLNYQWQKNGTPLVDDGRIVGSDSANLQISNCGPSDQADYGCVVSGYCGLTTRGGSEGVGSATTRAVINSSLAVIILDFIWSSLGYYFLQSRGL